MKVAVACDHAGFPLKDIVKKAISAAGHEVMDLGTNNCRPVDYPDYTEKLGQLIQSGQVERGILLCGSGVGACVAANKMRDVYACVCHDTYSARQGVEHDNLNVLCMGTRIIGSEIAREIVSTFIAARFIGNDPGQERHTRRVGKIKNLERQWGIKSE
jgi:ribose 5-phosphate isomerase B